MMMSDMMSGRQSDLHNENMDTVDQITRLTPPRVVNRRAILTKFGVCEFSLKLSPVFLNNVITRDGRIDKKKVRFTAFDEPRTQVFRAFVAKSKVSDSRSN